MRSRLAAMLIAFVFAPLASLPCHGGSYVPPDQQRGRDDVPPRSGSGGPNGPRGPTAPPTGPGPAGPAPRKPLPGSPSRGSGPGAPAGPGPGGPAGATPGTPRGYVIEDDETDWQAWWEMHKEPFLQRRRAAADLAVQTGSDDYFLGASRRPPTVDRLRATQDDIDRLVLPVLLAELQRGTQRDILSATLVAVAKAANGADRSGAVASAIGAHLRANDQEVRETAALALGITGIRTAPNIELLVHLARDSAAGRSATGRSAVDDRTRAFACIALGLLGQAPADCSARHRIATGLAAVLGDFELAQRDVRAAASLGLGLLDTGGDAASSRAISTMAATKLGDWFSRDLGRGEEFSQAQAPPAIASLVANDRGTAEPWRSTFAAVLSGKVRRGNAIAQSCAMALGRLPADDATLELLLTTWRDHRDAQTRAFAIMAVAELGGPAARTALLKELVRCNRPLEMSWLALALGVHAARGRDTAVDATIGQELRAALAARKNPSARGAIAIAIGLTGHQPAASDLLALLATTGDERLQGNLCIGLALLGDQRCRGELRAVLERSLNRPELLRLAATALSVIGDRTTVDDLVARLDGDTSLARLGAIAAALGAIGDRRALPALQRIAADSARIPLARAFAIAAIGGICDQRLLPWHTSLRGATNYAAAGDVLWNGSTGVLDIL